MKKIIEKTTNKLYKIAGMITVAVMMSPVAAYADALQSAEEASKGITTFSTDMTKKIIPIVVVGIGVALFIGGQRARENVKEGAPWKIAGLVLIFGAAAFGTTIGGWFN